MLFDIHRPQLDRHRAGLPIVEGRLLQLNSRHRQPGTRVHRPRAGIFIVLIALVFNLFMVPASALSNFDFTVERMEVQIHIGADGHAIIEQVLEYSFLEESTSTTLVLDAGQSSSISLLSVDLTDSILNQPEPVRPADRGEIGRAHV